MTSMVNYKDFDIVSAVVRTWPEIDQRSYLDQFLPSFERQVNEMARCLPMLQEALPGDELVAEMESDQSAAEALLAKAKALLAA